MVGVVARRGPRPKATASLCLRAVADFASTMPGQFLPARTVQTRAPEAGHFHRCSSRYGRLVRDVRVQANRSPPACCLSSEVTTRPRSSTNLSIPQSNSCMIASKIDNGRSPLSGTTKSTVSVIVWASAQRSPCQTQVNERSGFVSRNDLDAVAFESSGQKIVKRNLLGGFQYNSHSLLLFQR